MVMKDFIDIVQENTPVDEKGNRWSKVQCKTAIEAVLAGITEVIAKGESVRTDIGTFGVKEKSARECRNPKTGEIITVPAKTAPYFKANKALKDAADHK